MVDEPRADTNEVKETPQAPMPSAEQKTPQEAETPEGVQAPEGLPDQASEHAKEQFERLRGELRAEKEKRTYYENVFANLQAQQNSITPPKQEPVQPPPIYDPNTGLINEKAFEEMRKQAIEAKEQAKRAEEQVQSFQKNEAARQQRMEAEQAYQSYPQLNPENKSNFDKKLHVNTRSILLDSMLHPEDYGGKQLSFKQAADLAKGASPQVVEKAKAEGAKQAIENLQPKEQASLEATGNPNRRNEAEEEDLDKLKYETRKGGTNAEEALVLRMRKIYGTKG